MAFRKYIIVDVMLESKECFIFGFVWLHFIWCISTTKILSGVTRSFPGSNCLRKSRKDIICVVIVFLYQLRNEDKICTEEKVTDIKCILCTRPEEKKKSLKCLGRVSIHVSALAACRSCHQYQLPNINGWDCRRAVLKLFVFTVD